MVCMLQKINNFKHTQNNSFVLQSSKSGNNQIKTSIYFKIISFRRFMKFCSNSL